MKKVLTIALVAFAVISLSGCKKCYDCYVESGGVRSGTAEICGKDEAEDWEKANTISGVSTATCNEN